MEASAISVPSWRDATPTAGLATILGLAFVSGLLIGPGSGSLEEGVLLATLGLGAVGAGFGLRRGAPLALSMWGIVLVACLLLIAGESGRLVLGRMDAGPEEQWLLSGGFELSVYVLILVGAIGYLAGKSLIGWLLGLLDSAMISIPLIAACLAIVLPRLEEAGGSAVLPQLLAPAVAGTVLIMSLLALHATTAGSNPAYLFPTALAAGLVGDSLLVCHLLAGSGSESWLAGWEARALLVVLVTLFATQPLGIREERRSSVSVTRMAVLIVSYFGAVAFSAYAFIRRDQLAGFSVASVVSALFLLRLLLHAFDRHRHSEQLVKALREQEQLAVMDSLTGLYNRRFLDAELKLELDRSARSRQPVGILVCDLDHFKQINDRYGHLVGDTVLKEVAHRLIGAVRNGDLVARYGGEEFVVLLPGGNKEKLQEIGERCRRAFDETPFPFPKGEGMVTISIGGACWPEDATSARRLLEVADAALYRAKELGRNRIHVTENGVELPVTETARPVSGFVGETPFEDLAPAPMREGERIQRRAGLVARALGLDECAQRSCAMAARFHDIGKSVLPDSILSKGGPLSPVEWELVCEHPDRGARLVELAPGLERVAKIIREHHERYDGRGYPLGKCRDEISTEAQIVACCDAWSAMRADRPFARAKTASEARAELLAGRGTQFDPEVVMAFLMVDEEDLDAVVTA